jgi:tetratricopeptide (TPR) repeat protein
MAEGRRPSTRGVFEAAIAAVLSGAGYPIATYSFGALGFSPEEWERQWFGNLVAMSAIAVFAFFGSYFRSRAHDKDGELSDLQNDLRDRQEKLDKARSDLIAAQLRCDDLQAKLPETVLDLARRELRDGNEKPARHAIEVWLEQEGPFAGRLLLLLADWAAEHAIGDHRAAAFSVAERYASAAIALDPRGRDALDLLKDLSGLVTAEAQALPEFSVALEVLHGIDLTSRIDAEQIARAIEGAREARRLEQQGRYHLAIRMIDRVVVIFRSQIGSRALQTLRARQLKSRLLTALGHYHDALDEVRDVVLVQNSTPTIGRDHPDTLSSRDQLAVILAHLGAYAEARTVLEQVIAAWSASPDFGPDHPDTLSSRHQLAMVLNHLGDYAEARTVVEQVIAARSASPDFGPVHPYTLSSRHHLAVILDHLGDYAEAMTVLEQVIASRSASPDFGPDHPYTVSSRHQLAVILDHLGA